MKIHLLVAGDSAHAVGERLAAVLKAEGDATRIDEATGPRRTNPSLWPHPDLRVVITWRESRALMEAVDRSSAETGVPYTQAVFAHPRLRVGPTIVPGSKGGPSNTTGGCRQCFERRQLQHDAAAAKAEPLWRLYDEDEAAGPRGFLPHHVSMATALLAGVVRNLREGHLDEERNIVRAIHLLHGTTHRSELIPVHGCPRCHVAHPSSTWADLAAEFSPADTTRSLTHV